MQPAELRPTSGPTLTMFDVASMSRRACTLPPAEALIAHTIEPSVTRHFSNNAHLEQRTAIKTAQRSASGKGRLRRKTNKVCRLLAANAWCVNASTVNLIRALLPHGNGSRCSDGHVPRIRSLALEELWSLHPTSLIG